MRAVVFALLGFACSRPTEPAPAPKASVVASSALAPAVSVAPVSAAPSAGSADKRCVTPEAVGAVPLMELKGATPKERQGVEGARVELRRVLEDPTQFFAVVQATDDLVLIELWHRSAFSAEHCAEVGNPGGKCRTLGYDPRKGRVTSTKFWQ
ncbi:MAG: hypothetical protein QM756_22845 [Polyangiaceae bacterium]